MTVTMKLCRLFVAPTILGLVAAGCVATATASAHQKTITVDGTDSAIMTGNLTSQFYPTTRDFAVIDSNQIDVNAIEKAFDADFAHTAFTPTDGDNLVWSPTDSETQLLAPTQRGSGQWASCQAW
ncbi:MAG TPA: hypothetical protein VJX10_10425 [Pseudonocardiaceae bacterium]|nr:hypothetical protein [Pseudonocardiaceae bacterium]